MLNLYSSKRNVVLGLFVPFCVGTVCKRQVTLLPGLVLKDGMLYANAALPGAEIRYTTDNSEPTLQSPRWEGPTPCHAPVIKAKAFYLGKSSVTTILLTNL